MAMWSKQLPVYTVLVGDSFFGSHATAQRLAREGRPFITMVRKDTAGVLQAGDRIQAGQTAVATVDGHKYALQVYKQPKTGGKPPNLVPILSNVWYAARGPLESAALGRGWCRRAQGRQERGGRHARSRPERCCWGQNRIHGHQRRQGRRQRRQDPC